MRVMSSRLTIPPRRQAAWNSSSVVLLEENIIPASPVTPQRSARASSARDEQSQPQPSPWRIFKMAGVGVAFTAKYSRKPGFQAKAAFNRRAFSRIPFSS